MKILILVDSLKIGGGSDKVASILGSELNTEGYDVSFLTLSDESPKYDFEGNYYTLNEEDIYGNNIKRFFKLLQYSPRVKSLCDELKIDVVISAGDPANFHAIFSRYFFGNKAKIIVTQHMNPEIFLKSRMKYNLIKFFFPQADKTICVSREIERILKEEYNLRNTQTIYNMMDIEGNIQLSQEKLPEKYQELFNEKTFNFINIGRLDQQKGQWFLIRSFKKVVDKHGDARLFIIGEGDLQKTLEGLIHKLDLDKNVFLLGGQENVFPLLVNSDCFVFSSLWEGFGMVLLESLSVDLPTISTDCKTGPREILCPELGLDTQVEYPYYGEYGILIQNFPKKDLFMDLNDNPLLEQEIALSKEMITIIENPKLRKNYSKGLSLAKKFDKKHIISQWNDLLKTK